MPAVLEPVHAGLPGAVRRGESVFVPQEATHVVGIEAVSLDVAQRGVAGKAERLLAMVTKQGGGVKKRNQCIWVAIAILAAAVWTNTATAGFVDSRTAPGSSELEVTYKAVPVEDLALGIVPASYRVEYDKPEIKKQKVTVVGKGAWDGLLNKALKEAGLQSVIDEGKRVVTIKAVPVAVAPPPAKTPSKPTAQPSEAVAQPHWVIEPGDDLSVVIKKWADKEHWQFSWEAPQLIMQTHADIDGPFEGAIGKVVKALNNEGAGLEALFYTSNRALRIREKK
jgi:hypothetical protein